MDYQNISALEFLKAARNRVDGWAMFTSMVLLLGIYLVPMIFVEQTTISQKSATAAVWLVPIIPVLYTSLAYFSSDRTVSRIINAAILIGTPVFLIYR
jgi:hypothetical protein